MNDMALYWQTHSIQPSDSYVSIIEDLQTYAKDNHGLLTIVHYGDKFTIDESHDYTSTFSMHLPNKQILSILAYDIYLPEAQQKLLKTLEESPSHIHVLILASNGAGILPTIYSRCLLRDKIIQKTKAKASRKYTKLSGNMIQRYLTVIASKGNLPKTWIMDCEKWFR